MDFLEHDDLPFKLLIEYLSEDHPSPGLTPQDWNRLEKSFGERIYPETLYLLTQMEFEPEEAKSHWSKILEHREKLSRDLGRDIGLRVALCDYFINIEPKLKNLVFVEISLFMQKERTALIDDLTGLYNRRFFNRILKKEIEFARRFEQPFCLLMVDVDHFKEYNDRLGHQAGDRALVEVAKLLNKTARAIDHVIRYGGEEFVIILPRSDRKKGLQAAERHRRAIEKHDFFGQDQLPFGNLTVTVGLATFPTDADEGLDLLERADEALYQGKKTGRNQVVAWFPDKRRHPRYPLEVGMMFRLREAEEEKFRQGTIKNISLGGLLCESDHPTDVGHPLEVILTDPEEGRLSFKAHCVRLSREVQAKRNYYMGLSFELESAQQEEALKDLLEKRTTTVH